MSEGARRICFVIPTLGAGGTERQLQNLLRGLAEDHAVQVVCTREAGSSGGEVRRLARVRVLGLGSGWDPRLRARLEKEFRAYRPEIVHSFMFGFDYAVNAAARRAGVPVVISSRRQLATWKKARHVWIQRRANAIVDCAVANCSAVAEFAALQEGRPLDFYRVIPNGLNGAAFRSEGNPDLIRRRFGIPPGPPIVGMVANMSPVKDHALFVAMAAELVRRRVDVHFLLAGDGPLREEIEAAVRKAKLSEHFASLKSISELADVYRILAVSVLCSKAEGSPNVVLESMAAGVPVVAAAVGGVPEVVEDGVTGRLVSSRSPEDFADAVEAALADPEGSSAMASRASRLIEEKYSITGMVESYRTLYDELLRAAAQRKVG